jgi:hypothetical protein
MVVTRFIETMELSHVQGPKSNIEAEGEYLCADGFEGKDDNVELFQNSRERYGLERNV